jgi:excisionase family DNA binding protein
LRLFILDLSAFALYTWRSIGKRALRMGRSRLGVIHAWSLCFRRAHCRCSVLCTILVWTGGIDMTQDTLLNVKQVAGYLQLKESTIYSWAQDGKIPAIKIGRTWRFRRSDLDAWLERHLQEETDSDELMD